MRKRIPCKVIKSVTLGRSDENCQNASGLRVDRPRTDNIASLTYTSRLVATKSDIDNVYTARTLDLCA